MTFVGFKMIFIIALSLMGSVVNSKEYSEFKLPTNFNPVSYELNVVTHLEDKFMFEGVVGIRMTCVEATDTIVLHSKSLNINSESVVVVNTFGIVFPVDSVSFDPKKDLMYVKSTENFKPGDKYVLTIPFTGNITDQLAGYYRSSYVDKESNQTSPSKSDYVVDEFEESVPMSTYLVAYMVSDLVYTEANCGHDQVKFRIISRKDAVNETRFAIDLGPKVLKYYEDYFDEKFPLQKLDMVAISDVSVGGMENWVLVTYKENNILINLDLATVGDVQLVTRAIAHELAHQWFGNLVTMKWWTDLWLNEGFATYVAAHGVDLLYPGRNYFQYETVKYFIRVLDLDSLQSSHPVSVAVGHPDEIAQIFDTISYTKGSLLLRMMNTFLGKDTFKQGIRNYIHKHKFSNAEQDDLWSSLTEEAHRQGTLDKNLTVKQVMDTWTLQTGYPVLKVVRDYSAGTVTLSQERYLRIKSNGTDNKSCWWIPITMTTSGNFNQTNAKTWLNCKNNNLTTALAKDNKWVINNIQMAGLFRVLYDTRNWMGIISTLNDPTKYETIPILSRAQLIFDSLSFSQVGDMDYEITFQLLKYLKHEKEFAPWLAAFHGLLPINNLLKRTPKYAVFENYIQHMLSSSTKFGNMNDQTNGVEDTPFKNTVTIGVCNCQIKNCTQLALDLFRRWMKIIDPDKNNTLPIEVKPILYFQAIKSGGVDEWNFLWERYQRSNVESEQVILLTALGCSSETWLLNRYLNWSLDNSIIRKQDAYTIFNIVAKTDAGFSVSKDFLYRKIADIYEYYQPRGDRVGKYVNVIGSQMKTKGELEEMKSFINKSSGYLKGADLVINQTIEIIKRNTEWTSKFYNKTINYMVQYY